MEVTFKNKLSVSRFCPWTSGPGTSLRTGVSVPGGSIQGRPQKGDKNFQKQSKPSPLRENKWVGDG
jgi:hypothetical protein